MLDPGTRSSLETKHEEVTLQNSSLRIGEVARRACVSVDTLRHYERRGLLQNVHRTHSGYRIYSGDVVEQVGRIRSALAMGFTIKELATVFAVRNSGGIPCRRVRSMAVDKLSLLDLRIHEMVRLRKQLKATIRAWDAILEKTPAGQKARLLDVLTSSPKNSRRLSR